jgi:hypothetical protein
VTRYTYYQALKARARELRAHYGLDTPRVLRSDLRRIYRDQGVRIDMWPGKLKTLRGAYISDSLGATVMLATRLPPEPLIFTMAHELKHHLFDRDLTLSYCDPSNQNEPVEIGAEIFAAEFIFPEEEFADALRRHGISQGTCTPEHIVRLKHNSRTTLSYAGLAKRAEFLRFAPPGSLRNVRWKILEEQILGEPVHKRVARYRSARSVRPSPSTR